MGEIFQPGMFAHASQDFFTQSRDPDRGAAEFNPVGPGADRMLAIAQPIPVEQEPKAVVDVVTITLSLFSVNPVRGLEGHCSAGCRD